MAKNLVTLNVNNADYSLRPFATCQSGAAAENKVVSINDFELFEGATILVRFTNTNTHLNPTLNVNNTGAKTLICNKKLIADNIYEFVYYGGNWVHVNDTANNELEHIKYMLPDNLGHPVYILIAKLSNWVAGTASEYKFIGTIFGSRSGNQNQTIMHDIVAQAVSYAPNGINKILYTSLYRKDKGGIHPCIVSYTDENNETNNYLALKKIGSGSYIHFQGLTSGLLPQKDWIELPVAAGETLPAGMTEVATEDFAGTYYSLTTNKYFDGTEFRTLLHSANYGNYALPKAGGTISGDLTVTGSATINGNTTIKGSTTIGGNTTLGDSSNDTVTIAPNLTLKNNINFSAIDNANRFISFNYNNTTPQYSWRIGYLGEGQGENNFLTFQSGGITANSQFTDALKFGCGTLNATFAGNILPTIAANTTNKTSTQDIGAANSQWNNIYAKTIYQNGQELNDLFAPASLTDSCVTDEELTNALTNRINGLNYNPTDWSDTKYAAKVTQDKGVISVVYKDMLQLGTGNNNAARGDHNHDSAYTSSNTVNSMIETKIGGLDYTPAADEAKDTNYVAYISQSNGIIAPRVLPLPSNISGNAGSASKLKFVAKTDVNDCHNEKNLVHYNIGANRDADNESYAGTVKDDNGNKLTHGFPTTNNANSVLWVGTYYGDGEPPKTYGHQLGFSSDSNIYHRVIFNDNFANVSAAKGKSWKRIAYSTDISDYAAPITHTHTKSQITDFAHTHTKSQITDFEHTHTAASTTAAGFMTVADKTKLDGIESNANNYSLPPANPNNLGGIKAIKRDYAINQFSSGGTTGQYCAVELDVSNRAFINIPLTTNNTSNTNNINTAWPTDGKLELDSSYVIPGSGSFTINGFNDIPEKTSASVTILVFDSNITISSSISKLYWSYNTPTPVDTRGTYEIIITAYNVGGTTGTIYTGTWTRYN